MSKTVADLAGWIAARREKLNRSFRSDLIRLQLQYGNELLTEAIKLADASETRSRLSISASKARASEERREAEAVFRKKA
jgi:hypothetical protein